ncbi:hypothetical protein LOZ12_003197 [Ophidiomyces ophidiicola]|uniref:Uncharacterized protein n=1 Tax=Ophidiomyces ophidiicola TaxID=1387563 RepID=A0ACB8V032_9EURO|nr:hypothetical protein LOZ62_003800 [Ophidiomyces ophidiicola]KAI1956485.1 hypothetical protein LOZ59_004269 [Ophidiomyces ophidiicola]KAI1971004.1 hypothetical protein LOZ56_003318 [Ophidiomyces ophidiicola]KAI2019007.1 hypothetical protein LOZ46_003529 [Ophidiomyces ophidiicola]KAI2024023.1 hypothetical protein LOZ45_003767 [Ophidiomyces ophidiicola]
MTTPQESQEPHYVFKSWLDAAVFADEKIWGPLPDVVSTQGQYLKPRPETPAIEQHYDPAFVRDLEIHLDGLLYCQLLRREKYGDTADEWPPSHTPPEIKEKWMTKREEEMKIRQALLEIPTPEEEELILKLQPISTKKRKQQDSSPITNPCLGPLPLDTIRLLLGTAPRKKSARPSHSPNTPS